ncbi:MAG: LptF/LptG family permease [candidate division KSB1 bacterium]|nr:LptF/LptG family permease [candidate division KSB1 bacterium]MDZ7341809.1 LptF/LptG family permease [candidate division KSB1 bacterium]
MFILSKHILRQHIGPFLFGFFVITLLFLLNLVFKELGHILSKGLGFWVVLEFFALNLSWIIALAVPMAVLMACLMAFGQLSADNEITAIKASGVSLYHVILPVMIVAIGLSLFLIWFNNQVLPDSNHRLRLLARDIAVKKPTVNLEPGYLYQDIPNLAIRVERLEERQNVSQVQGVFIQDKSDANVYRTIIAERGEIFVNEQTGLFQITLYNGEIHEVKNDKLEQYNRIQFPRHAITIPIPNMVLERSDSEYRGDREQSSSMMRREVNANMSQIQKRNESLQSFINDQIQRYFSGAPVNDNILEEAESRHRVATSTAVSRPPTTPADSGAILPASLKQSQRSRLNLAKQIRIHHNMLNRIRSDLDINHGFELANNKLLVEIYKKYSIPFACLVFVLIGAPLGILARRGNMAVGGGISLVFFIIYWIFLIGGEELADRDMLSPFLSMWLANFVVGILGLYLLVRTVKEVSFINFNFLTRLLPQRLRSYFDSSR